MPDKPNILLMITAHGHPEHESRRLPMDFDSPRARGGTDTMPILYNLKCWFP